MGVYVYASESLRSGVQDIFKELDNGQDMTVSEVSKKLHSLAQIEETKETLHKSNGGKKKKGGELVLSVNSVQDVETKVCNNPKCGVTFTPALPSHNLCNNCFKSGFKVRKNDSLKLTADANKKHAENQQLKRKKRFAKTKGKKGDGKKGKKGGKTLEANTVEVGSENDAGEDSDSKKDENSETSDSEQDEEEVRKSKKAKVKSGKTTKALSQAQVVDILNSMDSKQRKKVLNFFDSSTAEMCMQSKDVSRNLANSDLHFNTLRDQNQAFSSETVEFIQYSSFDAATEVAVEEEISVQHPQPVVASLLTEMEENSLADNLDRMYSTESVIEQVMQETLNFSRRTQLEVDQAGYSLSPSDFRISIECRKR